MEPSDIWQQILAEPGNDSFKAQFVELLARAGDRRSEIFRLAAELKKYPVYYVQHAGLLRAYESSLADWRADFDTPARTWHAEVTFVQGWPVEITMPAAEFVDHAVEITATLPLRHLNLKAVEAAAELFEIRQLGQIVSLDGAHQAWPSKAIQALAYCLQLRSLRWLDLSQTGITDADVEILAASPHLRHLAHLDLSHNPCRDPVDAALGYGSDGITGLIVPESINLPQFGKELEARYGTIPWLHALDHYMEKHPPNRHLF